MHVHAEIRIKSLRPTYIRYIKATNQHCVPLARNAGARFNARS